MMEFEREWPEDLREAMNRIMYYHRDGTPYEDEPGRPATIQWAEDHQHMELRRVCLTDFWWGGQLSTVWLGLDHNDAPGARPLIFESMLFGWPYEMDFFGEGKFREAHSDLDMWRWSTEKDAIAGHSRLVREYRYPWRTIGWKECFAWGWSWFKSWDKGSADKRNVWSLFEENNHPKMAMEDMTRYLNEQTERLRGRREEKKHDEQV